MKNVKLLLIFCFGLFSQTLFSQVDSEVLIYSNDKYYYHYRIYDKKDLWELLTTKVKSKKLYKQHKAFKTTGHVLAVGTGILGCYTFYALEGIVNDKSGQGLVAGAVIVFPLTLTLTSYAIGGRKLNKSIEAFNTGNRPPDLGVLPMELKIGNTQNGVGVVLNF